MYITMNQATKVAEKDQGLVSTAKNYSKENSFLYYSCINYWCGLVAELRSDEYVPVLLDTVRENGLISVIKDASVMADSLILEEEDCAAPLYYDMWCWILSGLDLSDSLQILRFPKRLSPLRANKIAENSAKEFVRHNSMLRDRQRSPYSHFVVQLVKEEVNEITRHIKYEAITDTPSHPITTGYFSSGSAACGQKCVASKISHWAMPYYLSYEYPLGTKDEVPLHHVTTKYHDNHGLPIYCNDNSLVPDFYTAECQAVPKSYKASRIIAKEHPYRQWYMQAIRAELEACVQRAGKDKYIAFKDQEVNRFQCYKASIDGQYSTVDLSKASDSQSYSLTREVFPSQLMDIIDKYRSWTFKIGDQVHLTQMAFTSGSALTFPMETILFYSIARAATRFAARFYACGGINTQCYVYGDDSLVPTYAYETYVDFLELLGFTVNKDKSFSSSDYREACGVEYQEGSDTTAIYFPRKPLTQDLNSYESIRELHNALFSRYKSIKLFNVTLDIIKLLGVSVPTLSSFADVFDRDITDLLSPFRRTKVGIEFYLDESHDFSHPIKKEVEAHDCIVQKPKGRCTDYSRDAYEMYTYVNYLLYGPMYDSPLDEIIGVSTSRRGKNDFVISTKPMLE